MAEKRVIFTGSATAMVTPFTDGGLNLKALDRLVDYQLAGGTDALVVCGTTGEPSTMDISEEAVVISRTVERVAGRIPIITGAGSNDTAFAIRSAKQAKNLGADALLLVTPYYNKTSQQGLIRHFYRHCGCDRSAHHSVQHPRQNGSEYAALDAAGAVQARKYRRR